MTQCPNCGAGVRPDTVVCVKCGSVLRDAPQPSAPPPPAAPQQFPGAYTRPAQEFRSPFVAAALSLCIPGLGQLYNGQLGKAVVFFVALLVNTPLWFLCGLGVFFHVIAAFEAFYAAKAANRGVLP